MENQPLIIRLWKPRDIRQFSTLGSVFKRQVVIVAYTCFGDLILEDVESSSFAIAFICPFEMVPLGSHSLDETIELIEANTEARAELLKPDKAASLAARLGLLSEDEIYIPYPIPMLGGDGSIESYNKGNIWAHVEFVTA